jgi:hypothetical protein
MTVSRPIVAILEGIAVLCFGTPPRAQTSPLGAGGPAYQGAGTAAVAIASFEGDILAVDGTQVAGARVAYNRIPEWVQGNDHKLRRANNVNASGVLQTDALGHYKATGLPAGDYYLCVDVPLSTYLETCRWNGVKRVSVSAGAAVSNQPFKLQKGVSVAIHVSDQQGLLSATPDKPGAKPAIVVGVHLLAGVFYAASLVAANSTGRDYAITVPFDTAMHLWVLGTSVKLLDAAGLEIPQSGSLISLNVASNGLLAPAAAPQFSFTVVGSRSPVRP